MKRFAIVGIGIVATCALFVFAVFAAMEIRAEVPKTITITSPSSGQTVRSNSTVQVQWNASAVPGEGAFSSWYRVSGEEWAKIQDVTVPATNTRASWQVSWIVPNVTKGATLFVGYDKGDKNGAWEAYSVVELSISAQGTIGEPLPADQGSITLVSPNGGEVWKTGETQTISWQLVRGISSVNLRAECSEGFFAIATAVPTGQAGSYNWFIDPEKFSSARTCKIRAWSPVLTDVQDASDGVFVLSAPPAPPALSISSPTPGQFIPAGTLANIKWTVTPTPNAGKLAFYHRSQGSSWNRISAPSDPLSGNVSWAVPSDLGSYELFLGYDRGDKNGAWEAYALVQFSVSKGSGPAGASPVPVITISSPTPGQDIRGGSSASLTWTADPAPTIGMFSIYINSGSGWQKINDIINIAARSTGWSVPQTPGPATIFLGYDRGDKNKEWEAYSTVEFDITP